MKRLPIESRLDLVEALAHIPPTRAAYDAFARARRGALHVSDDDPGAATLVAGGLRATLVLDRFARVHVASLLDDDLDDDLAAELGIAATTRCEDLEAAFSRMRELLSARLGTPSSTGRWRPSCLLDEEHEHDFGFSAWSLGDSVLVLLHDEEGDAHIGEMATVDLRIAQARADLPESVRGPLTWPIDP